MLVGRKADAFEKARQAAAALKGRRTHSLRGQVAGTTMK